MNLRSCLLPLLGILVVGGTTTAACFDQASTGSTTEADFTAQGGVLGQAPKLELGKQRSGVITESQMDVWAVDLREGDQITVVETVTRGTLAPDFALFAGGHSHVRSATHDAQPKKLTKNYVATTGGKHFIGVAAFEGRGTGNYSIKVTCTGGPCAGQPFVAPLEEEDRNDCLKKARECALVKARPANGAKATLASARAAFDGCVKEASLPSGKSCASTCDDPENPTTCKEIADAIKFYANKPAACTSTLLSCMDDCIHAGDGSPISERVCMNEGLNGTCDGFSRANATCGGSEQPDSNEECHSLCHSTTGAWIDDLDTLCEEACPE